MTVPKRLRRGRGSRDLGAAAVEFALVVPILLLLVMGILDYGRFFFDSVSLRQGAREAARQAVVMHYPGILPGTTATLCSGQSTVGARIACSAKAASDSTIGDPMVYIPALPLLPTVVGGEAVGWARGRQLLVCMESREGGTGFVPLPGGGMGYGFIKTKTYMSIEVDSLPTDLDPSYSDPAPTGGGTWSSWCSYS